MLITVMIPTRMIICYRYVEVVSIHGKNILTMFVKKPFTPFLPFLFAVLVILVQNIPEGTSSAISNAAVVESDSGQSLEGSLDISTGSSETSTTAEDPNCIEEDIETSDGDSDTTPELEPSGHVAGGADVSIGVSESGALSETSSPGSSFDGSGSLIGSSGDDSDNVTELSEEPVSKETSVVIKDSSGETTESSSSLSSPGDDSGNAIGSVSGGTSNSGSEITGDSGLSGGDSPNIDGFIGTADGSSDISDIREGITSDTGGSITRDAEGSITGNAGGSITGDAGGSITGNAGGSITGNAGGSITGNAGGSITGNTGESINGDIGGGDGGSSPTNLDLEGLIESIIESPIGTSEADGSNGSTGNSGSGIWNILTGNAGGTITGQSAVGSNSSSSTALQDIVSEIGRIIASYSGTGFSNLTNENIPIIIDSIIKGFLEGSLDFGGGITGDGSANTSLEVNSVSDLITILQKYDLITFLRKIAQYLGQWQITINDTKYGILNMMTMPQEKLYGLIQYLIFQIKYFIDSIIQSILGHNIISDTIMGFGNKTLDCVVSSAVDLPAVVGNELVECVTGRVNEVIQLVSDAALEIRSSLILLRHVVDSIVGCPGSFCMGQSTATALFDGTNLIVNIIGTIIHFASFASTLAVQLPGCFVGSVTITPGQEIASTLGRFGMCMIS
ncbi:unnamed protein product [Phaedon cochleariae]|uniref:Uncharacterized protein n=1 Tax=Phaedon cochleariae TaxID=80249 RepID=A0A9P0DI73_PHACE|nr:unnamed protein product [Phaedon cochleariae]